MVALDHGGLKADKGNRSILLAVGRPQPAFFSSRRSGPPARAAPAKWLKFRARKNGGNKKASINLLARTGDGPNVGIGGSETG